MNKNLKKKMDKNATIFQTTNLNIFYYNLYLDISYMQIKNYILTREQSLFFLRTLLVAIVLFAAGPPYTENVKYEAFFI